MITLLLYVLLIYMIINLVVQKRAGGRINRVVEVIKLIEDKDAFLQKAQEEIDASKTNEDKTKFEILKLWGEVYHQEYTEFDEIVSSLDLECLLANKKMNNDDSFFYYLLAIPNLLQADGQIDKIHTMMDKVNTEEYTHRLDYALAVACNAYYENKEDRGQKFFQDLLDGNYEGYTYYNKLIGLYKQIAGTMLVPIYKESNDERYEEMADLAKSFYETRICTTWFKNIHLHLDGIEENDTQEQIPEVIDAEITEKEDSPVDTGSETGDSFVDENEEKN